MNIMKNLYAEYPFFEGHPLVFGYLFEATAPF